MFPFLPHLSVHPVRVRGGNVKYRALRLESGNFAWASEGFAHKVRILDVVYNASNNELVRTKTLVKNAIVEVYNPFLWVYVNCREQLAVHVS